MPFMSHGRFWEVLFGVALLLTLGVVQANLWAGEEMHSLYLALAPSVPAGVYLVHLGNVEEPTDIAITEAGLLVSSVRSHVVNVNNGGIYLDLRDRPDLPLFQSITYQDGYLYVFYVNRLLETRVVVARFAADEKGGDPDSEEIIMTVPAVPDAIHINGDLNFGPDGYLYVSLGDGNSSQGDPLGNGQDKTVLFASLMRLDVSGAGLPPDCDAAGNYTIPPDNPFVDGSGGNCDELWAKGLRQPWRVSFDRLTHDIWIGDVGGGLREEIDFLAAGSGGGENYGWNCYEGSVPYLPENCDEPLVFPVFEYDHLSGRCSIIGGHVYRGTAIAGLEGRYVYADLCTGEILYLDSHREEQLLLLRPGVEWVTFGEDEAGELYVADYLNGDVFRLEGRVEAP